MPYVYSNIKQFSKPESIEKRLTKRLTDSEVDLIKDALANYNSNVVRNYNEYIEGGLEAVKKDPSELVKLGLISEGASEAEIEEAALSEFKSADTVKLAPQIINKLDSKDFKLGEFEVAACLDALRMACAKAKFDKDKNLAKAIVKTISKFRLIPLSDTAVVSIAAASVLASIALTSILCSKITEGIFDRGLKKIQKNKA